MRDVVDASLLLHKKDSRWRRKWRPVLEALQGGKCCVCRRSPPFTQRVLDRLNDTPWGPQTEETLQKFWIDHDHESGVVRGLLCPDCNAALQSLEGFDPEEHQALVRGYLSEDGRLARARAHLHHAIEVAGEKVRLRERR